MSRSVPAVVLTAVVLFAAPLGAAPVGKPEPAAVELPVPAKVMLVAQVQGVERTRGRLAALVKAADPAAADAVAKQFDRFLEAELPGRDLKALPADGRVFLAVTGFDTLTSPDDAEVAVLFPATDYKAFQQKLLTADERKEFKKGRTVDRVEKDGTTTYFVDLTAKGYVAVTRHADTADLYAGKFVPLAAKDMGEAVAEAFLAADLSVYVNLDRVNDEYGDKIKQFRGLFQLLLQQGGGMGFPGLDKKQMELVKSLYDGLFQAVEDGKGLALGVEFRPQGLAVRVEAAFTPDSTTTKALGGDKPGKVEGLGELPAGKTTYTAGRVGAKLSAAMAKFGQEYVAEDGDEKGAALVEKYADLLAAASGNGFASAGSGPTASLEVLSPKDADALVAANLAVVKGLTAGGSFHGVVLKEKPGVKEAARKHAGFALHETRFVLDYDATVEKIEDKNLRETTVASMKRLVGEKPAVWFGTDGKRYVKVSAADWDGAKKLLDDFTSGKATVGATAAFKATRTQLPAEASAIGLFDLAEVLLSLGEQVGDVAGTVPGLPIGPLPKMKKPDGDPVYLGAALTVSPGALRFDTFVPVAAYGVGKKMLAPLIEKKDD
jgi:hypothetical protein